MCLYILYPTVIPKENLEKSWVFFVLEPLEFLAQDLNDESVSHICL